MTVATLRPGLRWYPDAEFYDAEMRRLRKELGRIPTADDIASDMAHVTAMMCSGCPCITCGATDIAGQRLGAAWRPGDADSLTGYVICGDCAKRYDDSDDRVYADQLEALLDVQRAEADHYHRVERPLEDAAARVRRTRPNHRPRPAPRSPTAATPPDPRQLALPEAD